MTRWRLTRVRRFSPVFSAPSDAREPPHSASKKAVTSRRGTFHFTGFLVAILVQGRFGISSDRTNTITYNNKHIILVLAENGHIIQP